MKTIYVIIACLMILLSTDFSLANIQQGNWRWRNDDGDVYTATWKDSVNTPVILTDYENIRLRIESTAWNPDTSNISLRYAEDGYKPYWINDEDFWTKINGIDTGKFYISPSLYLLDTASYFDNRLLPPMATWDTIFTYRKTITLDYTDNYNLLIKDSSSLFEFEYSLKPTLKIQPGSAYFFSLFEDSISMWNRNNSDYAVIMTPPINWFTQSFNSEYTYCYLNDIYFTDENIGTAVGYGWNDLNNGGVILRTINGGITWTQQTCPTNVYDLNAVCFVNRDVGTAVGNDGKIIRTTNGGDSWAKQNSGTLTCQLRSVCFTNADTGIAVGYEYTTTTNNSFILKTTNGGTTWTNQFYNNKTFLAVCFSDENKGTIVGAQGVILRTTNGGESWSPQVSGITNGDLSCVSFVDDDIGFAVGAEWDTLSRSVILKTTNGGNNWIKMLYGEPGPYLSSVQFIDQNTGWAVGEYGRILKTTDGGLNWKKLVSGTYRTLNAVHFVNSNTGWAVGQNKILKTTNGGITVDVDEEKSKNIPDNFYLSQNYPNPFNPVTKIKYSIPGVETRHASSVQLKVYDVLGNEVATLVNEEKPAGNYEVTWNAEGLSSGVYFYQLKAGNFTTTKKLLFLK